MVHVRKYDTSVEESVRGLEKARDRPRGATHRAEVRRELTARRRAASLPRDMRCPRCSRKMLERAWCAKDRVCISCSRHRRLTSRPELLVVKQENSEAVWAASILAMKRGLRISWDGVALALGVSNAQARKLSMQSVLPVKYAKRIDERWHTLIPVVTWRMEKMREARAGVGLKRMARDLRWTWQRLRAMEKGWKLPTEQEVEQVRASLLRLAQTT